MGKSKSGVKGSSFRVQMPEKGHLVVALISQKT